MFPDNLSIDELRELYVGKDAVYKENWTLAHLTVKQIVEVEDGLEVITTINDTPGFTANMEPGEYIFHPMVSSSVLIHGKCGYGYGTIRRVDSIDSLQEHYGYLYPDERWPEKKLSRAYPNELRRVFDSVLKNSKYCLAKEIAMKSFCESESEEVIAVADMIINNASKFIEWPNHSLLFMPGAVRNVKFHEYTDEQKLAIKNASIAIDRRSNGPAIMAYYLAGGHRPTRTNGNGWSIHHIYDGKFPFPGVDEICHAVKEPEHFSQAAGLVALHPVADGLASESPYFAWYLRLEAMKRFDYFPSECV